VRPQVALVTLPVVERVQAWSALLKVEVVFASALALQVALEPPVLSPLVRWAWWPVSAALQTAAQPSRRLL
jgi:hypothetical protein